MASMFPPKKNTAFTLVLVIRDADGDPVSGATGLDSEVSIDGGAFTDCTNEATEIGSTGIYTLALTAGEMNGDVIAVQTKTTSSGAKTAVNVMYTAGSLVDDIVATLATIAGYIDTEVAAIKAKTDNLPSDPADASDIAASLSTIAGYIDTEVAAIKAKTDLIPASPAAVSDIPTANANADALLDRTAGVETGWTIRQAMRIVLAVLSGKVSGAATSTVTIRNPGDSKNRVVATVDSDGNRSAVTTDVS